MSVVENRREQMFPVFDAGADGDREALCQRSGA